MPRIVRPKIVYPSEHQIQAAFHQWMQIQHPKVTAWATPNAGKRGYQVAARMRKEGLVAGVPDYFIAKRSSGPSNVGRYNGMFIEFKSQKGKLSEEQADMIGRLEEAGYYCVVCKTLEQAQRETNWYLHSS